MKAKIFGLLFLGLLLLTVPAKAQQKRSSIQINTGGYYLFGYRSLESDHLFDSRGAQANYKNIFAMQGIKYKYRFYKYLSVFAGYSLTNNQHRFYNFGNRVRGFSFEQQGAFYEIKAKYGWYYSDPHGILSERWGYHFFDAGLNYEYSKLGKSRISAELGLSFAYGQNIYITKLVWAPPMPDGSGDVELGAMRDDHVGYWGAVCGLSYDYIFWNNRLKAGVDIHFRYYEESMPFFMNYGLHVGCDF